MRRWTPRRGSGHIRLPADAVRVRTFMDLLGRRLDQEATIYLVGGASAVLLGWRSTTLDVDLRVEPDLVTGAVGELIVGLKQELELSVEFSSPPDFLPELPAWRDRSAFIDRIGRVTFRHFDFYSQALAKVRRGVDHDESDVAALIAAGLIEPEAAWRFYGAIRAEFRRYPAIDERAFRSRMTKAFGPPIAPLD